jgi:hypothetical protein
MGSARAGDCDIAQGVAMACLERPLVDVDLSFVRKIFFVASGSALSETVRRRDGKPTSEDHPGPGTGGLEI